MFDIIVMKASKFYEESSSGYVAITPNWVFEIAFDRIPRLQFGISRDEGCENSYCICLGSICFGATKKEI